MTTEASPGTLLQAETHYCVLTEAEALRFCDAEELTWVAREVRVAYEQGYVCVGALKDGHLVAWVWLNFNSMPPRLSGHVLSPSLERAIAKTLDRAELRS